MIIKIPRERVEIVENIKIEEENVNVDVGDSNLALENYIGLEPVLPSCSNIADDCINVGITDCTDHTVKYEYKCEINEDTEVEEEFIMPDVNTDDYNYTYYHQPYDESSMQQNSHEYEVFDNSENTELTELEYAFKCDVCDKYISTLRGLKLHKILSHNRKFSCKICSKKFLSNQSLRRHAKLFHTAREEPSDEDSDTQEPSEYAYKCDLCDKSSKTQRGLNLHKLRSHSERFSCDMCNKTFLTVLSLQKHTMLLHSEETKRDFDLVETQQGLGDFDEDTYRWDSDEDFNPNDFEYSEEVEYTYKCDECCKSLRSLVGLNQHKRKIHGTIAIKKEIVVSDYKCDLCDKYIKTKQGLHLHKLRSHKSPTDDDIFELECPACGQRFKSFPEFKAHTITSHAEKSYVCSQCNNVYKSEEVLRTHYKACLMGTGSKLDCGTCGKSFSTKNSLEVHSRKHMGVLYICKICDTKFTDVTSMYRHNKVKHQGEVYKCKVCSDRVFADDRGLTKHNKLVHNLWLPGGEKNLHQCALCDSTHLDKRELRKHLKRKHYPEFDSPYCSKCKIPFKIPALLHEHIYNYHNDPKDKKFRERAEKCLCKICNRFFSEPHGLKLHIRNRHIKLKTRTIHRCNHCGEKYFSKAYLSEHIHGAHFGIRHTCHICNKTFIHKKYYSCHLEAHKKQVTCNLCDSSFLFKSKLISHIAKLHIDAGNKLLCLKCDRTFRSKQHLLKHMTEKCSTSAFVCNYCNRHFNRKLHLICHIQGFHYLQVALSKS